MGNQAAAGIQQGSTAGFRVGAGLGAVPGAAIGAVAAVPGGVTGAVSGEDGFRAIHQGASIGAIAGGSILALPSAVVGGAVGGVAGSAADIGDAVASFTEAVQRDLTSSAERCSSSADARTLRLSHGNTSKTSIRLPDAATPLMWAIVLAQQDGALTEQEGLDIAAKFAATCAEQDLLPASAKELAESEAQITLMFSVLRHWYPEEGHDSVLTMAARLIEVLDEDDANGILIVCTAAPVYAWSLEIQALLPKEISGMSPRILETALRTVFEYERRSIAKMLEHHFPGMPKEEYLSQVDILRDDLSSLEFWKLWRLLSSPEALPETLKAFELSSMIVNERLEGHHCLHEILLKIPVLYPDDSSRNNIGSKVRAASSTSVASDAAAGELQIEVLSAKGLRDPEYRLGDLTKGLFGPAQVNPYVQVSFRGEVRQTRKVKAREDGNANFGEQLGFMLPCSLAEVDTLHVMVYDARDIQGILRGDALIGEATLRLSVSMDGRASMERIMLQRDGQEHGEITLTYGVAAPASVLPVLSGSRNHPLSMVVNALAQVLGGPQGVEILMSTRPTAMLGKGVRKEEELSTMLQGWVPRFCHQVGSLQGLSDEAAMVPLSHLVRRALNIVAASCQTTDADDIVKLTAEWVHAIFKRCSTESEPAIDEKRLCKLLKVRSL
jgi:hypothetical protein